MYKKIDDWINEKILDGSIENENTVSNINQEVMKFKKIPELDFESNKNFSGFYQILLRMAFDIMTDLFPKASEWEKSFVDDFYEELTDILEGISIKCLITEIHYNKINGNLKGDNDIDEYEYFNSNYFTSRKNLNEFFEAFPLLENMLIENITMYASNIAEMLESLERDKSGVIKEIFMGIEFNKIISMHIYGDAHINGKRVICLEFDNNKKLIYKPRKLTYEKNYYKFINFLYGNMGLETKYVKIVDGEECGWIEFIEQTPCLNELEIRNYYKRLGINLFVCYLMGNRDIHYENIISQGEFPVLIDLEVFECRDKNNPILTANEKAKNIIQNSVLSIGILPFYLESNKGKGINLSAMDAQVGKIMPYSIPTIRFRKTSSIKIEYSNPVIKKANNEILFEGKKICVEKYSEQIIEGFHWAYNFVMKSKEIFYSFLNQIKEIKCRIVLRNTQQYQMLINTLYWPELLIDETKRDDHINRVFLNGNRITDKPILLSEIRSMIKGDIPYFYFFPTETAMYTFDNKKINDYFAEPMMEIIEERFNNMSSKDLEVQLHFIEMAMALAKGNIKKIKNNYCLPNIMQQQQNNYEVDVLQSAVKRIKNEVFEKAIYYRNKDVSWIVPKLHMTNELEWHMDFTDVYIYSGIAGIAVFLHTLNLLPEYGEIKEMIQQLDKKLFSYTDSLMPDETIKEPGMNMTGAINGEGSVVYAYQLIYKLSKEEIYLDYAERHCEILLKKVETCIYQDLISGNAGAVIIFINMYKLTNNMKYLTWAIHTANVVLSKAKKQEIGGIAWEVKEVKLSLSGFSHGNAGILYALAKLLQLSDDEKYINAIREALKYENNLFDSTINNWIDIRKEEKDTDSVSWCHGAAGILLSRLELLKLDISDIHEIAEQDIKRAVDKIITMPLRNGMCLCHGNFGNISTLLSYLSIYNNDDLKKIISYYIHEVSNNIAEGKLSFIQQEIHPGFMNGLSGIGFLLLKIINPILPDVLKVDI